jgi:pyruvate, orthophosphate dikinase
MLPTPTPAGQDIEFTVENDVLFILQTHTAKRTACAAVKVAVDMVKEKLITEREALLRINPAQMDFFLHPMLDCDFGKTVMEGRLLCFLCCCELEVLCACA